MGRVRAVATFLVVLLVGALVGSALSQWGGGGILPGPEGARPRATGRVRVEVLNGGGHAGAAREATEALRELGFDVVFFGNAGTFDRDSSMVLDRMGTVERARDVADALGIRHVRCVPSSTLNLAVTVVLVMVGAPAPPPPAAPRTGPERPWWDPRRWLGR
ncbi:MAG: hypothetical protein AMXMBFR53_04720 [Gemmatimonadota bacterium]